MLLLLAILRRRRRGIECNDLYIFCIYFVYILFNVVMPLFVYIHALSNVNIQCQYIHSR